MGRLLGWPAVLMALCLLLDQLTKAAVRMYVPLYKTQTLIPNLIDLTHVENKGVSFSLLGNLDENWRVPLLVGVSGVAVLLLSFFWLRHRKEMSRLADLAFMLILPGAVGNLIDRAIFGTVTDFFHFRFYTVSFFVNNVADILISLGVVSYVLGTLLPQEPRQAREQTD